MMDTSAYLALRERRSDALTCRASIRERRFPQYVTSTVVAEAHRRFLFDHGRRAALDFLKRAFASQTVIVRPREEDEREATRLIEKYSSLNLTFCDALTMSVMLHLGIKRAFTYDRNDFWAVGFITVPPLDI